MYDAIFSSPLFTDPGGIRNSCLVDIGTPDEADLIKRQTITSQTRVPFSDDRIVALPARPQYPLVSKTSISNTGGAFTDHSDSENNIESPPTCHIALIIQVTELISSHSELIEP
jgi:hypothetical protein